MIDPGFTYNYSTITYKDDKIKSSSFITHQAEVENQRDFIRCMRGQLVEMIAVSQEVLQAFQTKGVSGEPMELEYDGRVHGLVEALARYDRQLARHSIVIG